MAFKDFSPIMDIDSCTIKWSIRARIQSLWHGITRETKEFRGINMLLIDDCGTRIHAFITAKICKLFENALKEGDIYKFSNFYVKDYVGDELNRCVRNGKHLYFADFTTVVPDSNLFLQIPEYSFDIKNLSSMDKMDSDKRFLCDVIGFVVGKHTKHEYSSENNETKTQVKFSITDGSCVRKVNFFDKFAQSVDEKLNQQSEDSFIVVIASAKVNKYEGELYLTNYPATRFYVNANHYSVKEFQIKSLNPSFEKNPVHVEESEIIHVMKVSEIISLDHKFKGRNVICELTFKKVQQESNWFAYECLKCDCDLVLNDGKYLCPKSKCGRNYPYPERRFRICGLFSDHTGVIAIVLRDRELKKLTGKTVFEIMLDEAEDSVVGYFPPCIKCLEGKEYTITLCITEDNIQGGSRVYEASSIFEGFEITADNKSNIDPEAHTEENVNSTDMECYITKSFTCEEKTKPSLPCKKSRSRKSPRTISVIDDENAPLAKCKTMKIEKVAVK